MRGELIGAKLLLEHFKQFDMEPFAFPTKLTKVQKENLFNENNECVKAPGGDCPIHVEKRSAMQEFLKTHARKFLKDESEYFNEANVQSAGFKLARYPLVKELTKENRRGRRTSTAAIPGAASQTAQ